MVRRPDYSERNPRTEAGAFLASIREHLDRIDSPGMVSGAELVRRVSEHAGREAKGWATREGRHRFLAELSSAVNSRWMSEGEPDGPRAQFYAALRDRLREIAEAEHG